MSKLDLTRDFVPVRIAVLTVSDTRTLSDDKSGDLLATKISEAGHVLVRREITQDEVHKITQKLKDSIQESIRASEEE